MAAVVDIQVLRDMVAAGEDILKGVVVLMLDELEDLRRFRDANVAYRQATLDCDRRLSLLRKHRDDAMAVQLANKARQP